MVSVKAYGWLKIKIQKILKRKKEKKKKILDLGSGSGEFINSIAHDTNCEGYGHDLSNDRIERAKLEFTNTNFKCGSFSDTGYDNDAFDIIVSTQTIEHLLDNDLDSCFTEISRILKHKICIAYNSFIKNLFPIDKTSMS